MPISVTIVIVTFNSENEILDCIESCLKAEEAVQIIVIDNNSKDKTVDLVKGCIDDRIEIIKNSRNLGLAAANNMALPHLKGNVTLILNPDTTLHEDTLSHLCNCLNDELDVGVVGPLNLYETGAYHTSYHHSWNFLHLVVWRILPYSMVRYLYDKFARYRECDVAFVSGSCLMIRTSLFREVGGYDPAFFLTVEDACDLCRRIRGLGFRIKFYPKAKMTHFCGRSNQQVPELSTLEGYRGDIHYFRKYYGRLGGAMAKSILITACVSKIVGATVRGSLFRRKVSRFNSRVYSKILPRLLRA